MNKPKSETERAAMIGVRNKLAREHLDREARTALVHATDEQILAEAKRRGLISEEGTE
jgi:hypothetical protein